MENGPWNSYDGLGPPPAELTHGTRYRLLGPLPRKRGHHPSHLSGMEQHVLSERGELVESLPQG